MRLIDAEALVGDLVNLYNAKRDEWCDNRNPFTDHLLKRDRESAIRAEKLYVAVKAIEDVIEVIQNAKVIEAPAEPKKGKWIDETFKPNGLAWYPYRCNQCGCHNDYASMYCPDCGAKMEGEEDDV